MDPDTLGTKAKKRDFARRHEISSLGDVNATRFFQFPALFHIAHTYTGQLNCRFENRTPILNSNRYHIHNGVPNPPPHIPPPRIATSEHITPLPQYRKRTQPLLGASPRRRRTNWVRFLPLPHHPSLLTVHPRHVDGENLKVDLTMAGRPRRQGQDQPRRTLCGRVRRVFPKRHERCCADAGCQDAEHA
jgi:hypothetical protein